MSQTPIRIGIIGAGGIVKTRHLPGLAKVDDCQVVAVHNRRRANAEAVAAEWKIPHVVDSAEAVYGRADINAVLIGTTPYLHKELTLKSLAAGKHVFCQARMARDLAEARDMLAAARAYPRLVTMICPAPHVDAGDRVVRKILDAASSATSASCASTTCPRPTCPRTRRTTGAWIATSPVTMCSRSACSRRSSSAGSAPPARSRPPARSSRASGATPRRAR